MADPLSLLRQYNVDKKEIIERDNQIILGEFAWNKNAKTNYLMWKSPKERSSVKEYYTLESLLFILKNVNLHHADYVRQATAAKIPIVHRPVRKDVLAYLNGITATNASIDKSIRPESPIQVKKTHETDDLKCSAKKPRMEMKQEPDESECSAKKSRMERKQEHDDLECSAKEPRTGLKQEPDEPECAAKEPRTGVTQEPDEPESSAKEPRTGLKQEPDEPECAAKKPRIHEK